MGDERQACGVDCHGRAAKGGARKAFCEKKFGLAQLGTLAQAGGACRTAWLLATLAPTCGAISPSDVANLPGFPAGRATCCWQEWPAALVAPDRRKHLRLPGGASGAMDSL